MINLFSGISSIKTINKGGLEDVKYPTKGNLKQVLSIYWNDMYMKRHPAMYKYFSLLIQGKDGKIVDNKGNNIYVYSKNGNNALFTNFSNQNI